MSTLEQYQEIAHRHLPARSPKCLLHFPEKPEMGEDWTHPIRIKDDELLVELMAVGYEEDGSIGSVMVFCARFDLAKLSAARWAAYWEAAVRVLPEVGSGIDVHRPDLIDDPSNNTVEDFVRGFHSPEPSVLEETQAAYEEFLRSARPEPREKTLARRAAAFERAMANHDKVAARFLRSHGLRLPKSAALTWAIFTSLSPNEWAATRALMGITPTSVSCGVLRLYSDRAFELPLKEGFDERIHYVSAIHPPEAPVMFLAECASFAYFFDDPRDLPSGVVKFMNDTPSVWVGETFWDFFILWTDKVLERPWNFIETQNRREFRELFCQLRLFREALEDFRDYAEAVREEDQKGMRWSYEERSQMARQPSGIGIATPQGDSEGLWLPENILEDAIQSEIAEHVDQARSELAQGNPRYALALGRELFCQGRASVRGEPSTESYAPPWQDESLELLVGAYEQLGRDALAQNVKVLHEHRGIFLESAFVEVPPSIEIQEIKLQHHVDPGLGTLVVQDDGSETVVWVGVLHPETAPLRFFFEAPRDVWPDQASLGRVKAFLATRDERIAEARAAIVDELQRNPEGLGVQATDVEALLREGETSLVEQPEISLYLDEGVFVLFRAGKLPPYVTVTFDAGRPPRVDTVSAGG
ncbi:hypothetical protein [Polyangium sp. 6x1]|uniref:hypothetical protein n=1 Tax=Polyangium sp. 6x1 TaxID=3042689 RepID=UPI00248285B4|nr:hypothetical protein [Polyangium sp. 6x1]MDI1445190.1 hypothetical protein [Polyangium sp. 6x1]